MAHRRVSIALACRAFSISETCYRYERKLSDENEQIADLLIGLTTTKKTWGFGLCFLYLRNVQGAFMEPQARLPHLLRVGAESADQAAQALEA